MSADELNTRENGKAAVVEKAGEVSHPSRNGRLMLSSLFPLAAFALQWLFWTAIQPLVWFLFYPAVFFSSWVGGMRAGLAATAISTVVVWWFFIPPQYSFALERPASFLSIGIFGVMGVLFSVTHERLRKANQEAAAALVEVNTARDSLEERISGRTADLVRTSDALRESNLRLQMSVHSAGIGIHQWNVITNELIWDARVYEFWGLSPGTPLNYELFMQGVHPDDRTRVQAAIDPLFDPKGDGKYFIQYRVIGIQTGIERWLELSGQMFFENGRPMRFLGTAIDITERKRAQQERETTIAFLRLVNDSTGTRDLVQATATFFQQQSGCEAVGIRLHEGEDYPYYEARGFPDEFVLMENSLCARDAGGRVIRDSAGDPVIECMCGNVIRGRTNPSKPFFTAHGSFWTNNTTELLRSTTEADRQSRTRNRCNGEGYESVALLPLRLGELRLGLLQLNDRRSGVFSREGISSWERLADHLAVALAKFRTEEDLRKSEQRYRSLFDNMIEGFAHCRMFFEGDDPKDFIYLDVNSAFEKLTGLKNVVGKRVSEVIPGIRQADPLLFEIYGRVAKTGEPDRFEMYVEALQMWFHISVYSPKKEHFVAVFDVITDRKKAEEALRNSEAELRKAQKVANVGNWVWHIKTGRVEWSDQMYHIFGIDKNGFTGDLAGVIARAVHPDDRAEVERVNLEVIRDKKATPLEYRVVWPDGTVRVVWTEAGELVLDEKGEPSVLTGIVQDITENRRLEAQYLHAQKMESIGTLAGGIAHDFNNILSAIIGYGHVALMNMAEDDPQRLNIENMLEAADRAAHLTKELLLFSRKQISERKPVNLNDVVRKVEKFLRRVIGEDVECKTMLPERPLTISADSHHLEQVLMNLATNARDAMPGGGTFTIQTEEVSLHNDFIAVHGYGKTGQYAMITVSDTGKGMDEATRKRIFEPFFTTKEVGKGTGLGLAVVYGILKDHEGFINVYSEPGKGTTFRIYLPIVPSAERGEDITQRQEVPARGVEMVLLAEDDANLRKLTQTVLEGFGYTVITANDGEDAIAKFREHRDDIRLLLFDLIMPRMSGKEAFDEIRKMKPDIKVIFASGYAPDLVLQKAQIDGSRLVLKPISPHELLRKVRSVLDGAD